MPDASELWTIAKAAEKLCTRYGRIDTRVKSGHIPHTRLGSGQIVVTLSDVQAYLDTPLRRGRVGPSDSAGPGAEEGT